MGESERPDLPETIAEAGPVLEDESFYTPVQELPDDPEQLRNHIETLYVHLARASTVIGYNERVREERREQAQEVATAQKERADELSERVAAIREDIVGKTPDPPEADDAN
jgi:hypothetical protein